MVNGEQGIKLLRLGVILAGFACTRVSDFCEIITSAPHVTFDMFETVLRLV